MEVQRSSYFLLRELLGYFPCVVIVGPRQCGKTTLLGMLGDEWQIYDMERASDFRAVAQDPDGFLRLHPQGTAFDEAQLLPEIFPALRVAIDSNRNQPGRFVITGSSSPDLASRISESLAGRVGIIELGPLSLAEIQGRHECQWLSLLRDGTSLQTFLSNSQEVTDTTLIHDYWLCGGYPEPWLKHDTRFRSLWMDTYTQTYIQRDIANLFPKLDATRFRLFIGVLAGLSGTILNYAQVAQSLGVSQPTVRDYFEIAHGTFLWRKLPSFQANSLKRLTKHPKGYMRDSGLLHHLLRIGSLDHLLAHPQLGQSWEGMVIEEIMRSLKAHGVSFDAYYYRTAAGAEVDFVLEGEFGLVPFEIKYGTSSKRQLRALIDFMKDYNCRYGFVITNDTHAHLITDQIINLPFSHLQ